LLSGQDGSSKEEIKMMNIFTFPNIDEPRKTIAALLTSQPGWDENRIKKTMEVFHMEEKERRDDAGPRLVVRSDTRELEIFRTSDSIRWSMIDKKNEEPGEPVDLPDDREAIRRADIFLDRYRLADANATLHSVTRSHHSRIGKDNKVLLSHPVATHVNYVFRIDGLPVFGPGAKMQVTFTDEETPVQIYKFWRETRKGQAFDTVSYERAMDLVRSHPSFAAMARAGRNQIAFDRAQLGYYAFTARHRQQMLVPVYRFDGAARGKEGEHYRFGLNVIAIDLSPAEIKASRMTTRHKLPAVFSA
jgi:hypothetical protein